MIELLDTTERAGAGAPGRGAELPPRTPAGLEGLVFERDERPSRVELRRQIARLEQELCLLCEAVFPRHGIDCRVGLETGGPRLLGVGELEQVRDALVSRVGEVRGLFADRARAEEGKRELIERMRADPGAYKWVRISSEDIGELGCRHWDSRPRWGLLGMLLGWWRVKVSSGCPLAGGPPRPRPLQGTPR